MESPRSTSPPPAAERGGPLGVLDAANIIIGIVVGTVIFKSPIEIFHGSGGPWGGLLAWLIGGVFAFIGAMCYAELATSYPRSGGDYVYLTKAFGPWAGFLFAWAQLTVLLPAAIGTMAVVFGQYATTLRDLSADFPGAGLSSEILYAFAGIAGITLLNMIGVVVGKLAQMLLTVLKIAGLIAIIVAGLAFSKSTPTEWPSDTSAAWTWGPASLILTMYAFGGWNDAGFVAAEVRNPSRNIPRALFFGLGIITVLYLLVNFAYLTSVGFDTASQAGKEDRSKWPLLPLKVLENAHDQITPAVEGDGAIQADGAKLPVQAMAIVILISALGAVNGLTFAGSRVYATLGNDYKLFTWLGHWKPGRGAPLLALLFQAAMTAAMVAGFGTKAGHELVNQAVGIVGVQFDPAPGDAFGQLFATTAPIFWALFLMTGLSLFVLREKKPASERPFSVPLYPILPILFCNMCCYGFYSAVVFMHNVMKLTPACLLLVGLVLLGLPLYGLSRLVGYRDSAADQ
jgi:basic amino acid/polyamine antiporter, APA family